MNLSAQQARMIALLRLALAMSPFALASAETSTTAASPEDGDDANHSILILDAFSVSVYRDYGYRASNSIAATRTNTPIKDVPLNIQVFTADLWNDLGVKSQIELESYNASLVDAGRDLHSDNVVVPATLLFRGFAQAWQLRDGIREYDPVDTQGLARVEVVKGPAAALYGLTFPGGVIQSISKTVEFGRPFAKLRFTVGDEGDYRAAIDANYSGSVGRSEFGLRFNGVTEKTEDERAHSEGKVELASVTGAWIPWPATKLEVLAERGYREKPNGLGWFTQPEFPDDSGVMSLNHADVPLQIVHPEIPWTWNWSNGKNVRALETNLFRGTLTQRFGEHWEARGYWQYSDRYQPDSNGWGAVGDWGAPSFFQGVAGWQSGWVTDPLTRHEEIRSIYTQQDWSNDMHAYGVTAVCKYDFTPVKNTFAFGANAWGEKEIGTIASQFPGAPTYVTYPVVADIPITVPATPPSGIIPSVGLHQNNSNDILFVNWQAAWWRDRLKTNVGLSRTNLKMIDYPTSFVPEGQEFTQSQTSPLFGAVFELTHDVSLFALHATSLFPDPTLDSHHQHFSPLVGKSLEAGVKFETSSGVLSGTISVYRIVQSGGAQFDPAADNADPSITGDYVQGGEQESKGFEADIVWQPTRSWQVVVSYAHNDQQITESAQAHTIGNSEPGHIADRYVFVTKYTFAEGSARGAFVGIAVSGGTKALRDYIEWPVGSGQFVARYEPGRAIAELFAGCPFKVFQQTAWVQLNIKNLTRAPDYVGWQATGSPNVLATERYHAPTAAVYRLTFGIDF